MLKAFIDTEDIRNRNEKVSILDTNYTHQMWTKEVFIRWVSQRIVTAMMYQSVHTILGIAEANQYCAFRIHPSPRSSNLPRSLLLFKNTHLLKLSRSTLSGILIFQEYPSSKTIIPISQKHPSFRSTLLGALS